MFSLSKILKEALLEKKGSVLIEDEELILRHVANEDFPFLVSFPRTGSHWLRMLMELYFEKPALVRAFFYHDKKAFLMLHTHDMAFEVERRNVIYLYRDPVETVYSQIKYEKQDVNSSEVVKYWSDYYRKHLEKWLIEETFTTKKTLIRYDRLMSGMETEFEKLSSHFGEEIDSGRLQQVCGQVSKDELKKKTKHDGQVVNLSSEYADHRTIFVKRFSDFIQQNTFGASPALTDYFG